MKQILLISGSLRAHSINSGLLRSFADAVPVDIEVVWADLRLPLFNQELEADFPAAALTLRNQILAADIIVISTPEYNRGMPGVLKNAIDWGSRPSRENAWQGKRVLVAAASPSGIGGALAVYQVKQSLLHLDAQIMGQPEFMVGSAGDKFTDDGTLTDEKTQSRVTAAVKHLLG